MRDDTWRALEDLHDEGKLKHIGVSNYSSDHLAQLLGHCRYRPLVNQIELHPLLPQKDLVECCRAAGVQLQAFASLGGGDSAEKRPLLGSRAVQSVADAHKKTPAQVLLRWAMQKGFCVIPKSRTEARMRENRRLDFVLSAGQLATLDGLCMGGKRLTWKGVAPESVP
jgi:diketogulonate reductase-like aldo/keto reductase